MFDKGFEYTSEYLVNIYQITELQPLEAATRGVHQRKGILRNFAKFTGKHLCQSLFFNKVAGAACNFF